jgi:hypothetical protein
VYYLAIYSRAWRQKHWTGVRALALGTTRERVPADLRCLETGKHWSCRRGTQGPGRANTWRHVSVSWIEFASPLIASATALTLVWYVHSWVCGKNKFWKNIFFGLKLFYIEVWWTLDAFLWHVFFWQGRTPRPLGGALMAFSAGKRGGVPFF